MHIPRFTPVPPDYVQGWSNPEDWWYMPAYLGGGGLPKGAPIPGSTNYGGIPSGIGSGTGGGPVTFPNYGTVGGSGGGSNAMLAAGGTGVDLYSNGQPVTQFGGTPVPVSGGGGIGSV